MNAVVTIQIRARGQQAMREVDAVSSKIKEVQRQTSRAGRGMAAAFDGGFEAVSRWGSSMQWAGRQLMMNFTVPLAAAGFKFTQWVMENEKALVRLQKVYADTVTGVNHFERDVEGLSKAFELLSVRYGIHQSEVREIAGSWAQAGARGAALANGVESTLKTMILGEMDAVEATQALISIQAQWGASSEGLIDIINKINATENNTATTFKGLVEAMSRSASTARSAGVDVEHLLAMITAITPSAGSATQAGNALKTMISRVLSPTKSATEVLGLMGINTADMSWKMLTAAQRLELMAEKYHDLENSADGYISSQAGVVATEMASRFQINRFDALMRDVYASINDNADANGYYGQTLRVLGEDSNYASAAIQEINTVLQSSPRMMERAGVVMRNSFMKVIYNILPQIMALVNWVATLTQKFSEMDPRLQKVLIALAGFLALLGPPIVMLGTLTVAVGRLGMFLSGLKWIIGQLKLKAFATGLGKVGEAFGGAWGKVKQFSAWLLNLVGISKTSSGAVAASAGASAAAQDVAAAAAERSAALQITAAQTASASVATAAEAIPAAFQIGWAGAAAATRTGGAVAAKASREAVAATVGAVITPVARYIPAAFQIGWAGAAGATMSAGMSAVTATTIVDGKLRAIIFGIARYIPAAFQIGWAGAVEATRVAAVELASGMVLLDGKLKPIISAPPRYIASAYQIGWAGAVEATRVAAVELASGMALVDNTLRPIIALPARYIPAAFQIGWAGAAGATLAGGMEVVSGATIVGGRLSAVIIPAARIIPVEFARAWYLAKLATIKGVGDVSAIQTAILPSTGITFAGMSRIIPPAYQLAWRGAAEITARGGAIVLGVHNNVLWRHRVIAAETAAVIPAGYAKGWAQAAAVSSTGAKVIEGTIVSSTVRTSAVSAAAGASVGKGFLAGLKSLPRRVLGLFRGLGVGIVGAVKGVGPLIGRVVLGFARFITGPIGLIITAVVALLWSFRDQVKQIFVNIGKQFSSMTTPFGKAWQGVLNIFGQGMDLLHRMFRALPEGIQNALRAVVDLVQRAAMKVYELFSYLNPFARHSPSLVENVTAGMKIVGEQFGLASRAIRAHMVGAYSSLKRFGAATANFMKRVSDMRSAEERSTIRRVAPGAVGSYDSLNRQLPTLRADLDRVSVAMTKQEGIVAKLKNELDAQQRVVDGLQKAYSKLQKAAEKISDAMSAAQEKLNEYAQMGITGQREMSDAIFENEMAQKRLRLEILRLEEAHGTVDDLRSRMASLRGDIEYLQGRAKDLRSQGAGSDILGPIEQQIAAMEAEYKALSQGSSAAVGPISELEEQLKELQRQGEILDLEGAIKYDPLVRQIEQLTDGYEELPFDKIVAGIRDQQRELATLEPQYRSATDAVDRQRDALEAAREQLEEVNERYDAQEQILSGLKSVYSGIEEQIRDIETAIRDVVSAAEEMERALEAAARAAAAKKGAGAGANALSPGAQNFLDAAGGFFEDPGEFNIIADEAGDIDAWIDDFLANSGTIFESVDIFQPIKDGWQNFKTWWGDNVTPIFSNFGQGIKEIFSDVDWGDWDIDWGATFSDIGTSIVDGMFGWMGDYEQILKDALSDWWDRVTAPLVEALGPIRDALTEAWEKIKPSLEGLWESIQGWADILAGVFGVIWDKVKQGFGEVLTIVGVVAGAIGALVGGLVIIISSIFSRVIAPIIDIITAIITTVIDVITGIINFVTAILTGDWKAAWDAIKDTFWAVVDGIIGFFTGLDDLIIGIFWGLVEGVMSAWEWLWGILQSLIPDQIESVKTWFIDMKDSVVDFVITMKDKVVEWFMALWHDSVAAVKSMFNGIVKWFKDLNDDAIAKAREIKTKVVEWFVQLKDDAIAKAREMKDKVVGWFTDLKDSAIDRFLSIRDKVREYITAAKDLAIEQAKQLRDKVMTPINFLRDKFLDAFRTVRDKIGDIFNSIKTRVQSGMNGPIKAVNALINGLNKVASVLPGINWSISLIPEFEQGGILPKRVGSGFVTSGARAIVGEGNPAHPEYVIPTDPAHRARANELYRALGKTLGQATDDPALAAGGPVDTIKSWIGKGSNLIREGVDWMENVARGAVTVVLRPFKNIVDDRIARMTWQYGRDIVQAGTDKVWSWATDADEAYRRAEKEAGGVWRRPMSRYSITSRFGPRSLLGNSFHAGIDLANGGGSNIYAAATGRVVRKGYNAIGGRSGLGLALMHGNKTYSYYGHLRSAHVGLGDTVGVGKRIGIEGATGNVTGPHLHFEIHQGGIGAAINPEPFMRSRGVPLAEGGIVRSRPGGVFANIGEGRHDEAVIPLPYGWKQTFAALGGMGSLRGPVITQVEAMTVTGAIRAREIVVEGKGAVVHKEINFYGDLSFPSVESGDDAESLIRNLEDLAGGR